MDASLGVENPEPLLPVGLNLERFTSQLTSIEEEPSNNKSTGTSSKSTIPTAINNAYFDSDFDSIPIRKAAAPEKVIPSKEEAKQPKRAGKVVRARSGDVAVVPTSEQPANTTTSATDAITLQDTAPLSYSTDAPPEPLVATEIPIAPPEVLPATEVKLKEPPVIPPVIPDESLLEEESLVDVTAVSESIEDVVGGKSKAKKKKKNKNKKPAAAETELTLGAIAELEAVAEEIVEASEERRLVESSLDDSGLFFESSQMEVSRYDVTPERRNVSMLSLAPGLTPIQMKLEEDMSFVVEQREEALQAITEESFVSESAAGVGEESEGRLLTVRREYEEAIARLHAQLEGKEKEAEAAAVALETERRASQQSRQAAEESNVRAAEVEKSVRLLKEVVAERERALEVATTKMSELTVQNEKLATKLSDLGSEIKAKDAKLSVLQSLSTSEADLKRQIERLLDESHEKDQRLVAFETEGRDLAKKQGEMEKSYRQMSKTVKDKDAEISRLQEGKEALGRTIEQLQGDLKRVEQESTSASKSLSAMQAVSSVSSERLVRVEAELAARTEELASQKKALESAWAETGELKRLLTEARAERDEFKSQTSEDFGRLQGMDELKRQYEQREAVLRTTSKQMQDTLQRQMQEASSREERLREEAAEMRRKWQDAVMSRENLTAEMGDATAPLLRQIASVQDALRQKSEQWQSAESALNERAIRAESASEKAEHRRALLEEQMGTYKESLAATKTRLNEVQALLQAAEDRSLALAQQDKVNSEKIKELEARLVTESAARQSLTSLQRETESKHSLALEEAREALAGVTRQHETVVVQLKRDIAVLREQLETKMAMPQVSRWSESPRPGDTSKITGTFVESAKMKQKLQQQEDRGVEMAVHAQQLQAARDALLQEVGYLNTKNAALEEQVTNYAAIKNDLEVKSVQNNVLLTLLGEKEEELELLYSDLKEVKTMYKEQISELLAKIIPSHSAGGGGLTEIPLT